MRPLSAGAGNVSLRARTPRCTRKLGVYVNKCRCRNCTAKSALRVQNVGFVRAKPSVCMRREKSLRTGSASLRFSFGSTISLLHQQRRKVTLDVWHDVTGSFRDEIVGSAGNDDQLGAGQQLCETAPDSD